MQRRHCEHPVFYTQNSLPCTASMDYYLNIYIKNLWPGWIPCSLSQEDVSELSVALPYAG